jgi:glycine cleavage system H protein
MIFMLLVLLTFAAGVLVDYALTRGRQKAAVGQVVLAPIAVPVCMPRYVEGFLVPDGLRYHAGHTWVQRERSNMARVGVDEFAARLAGNIDKIDLPKPGQWFRQGQPVFKVHRNGETATLLSPIEGEVVEVNQNVVNDPPLLRHDSYGAGWLVTLHVFDEHSTWRNLLPVNLVKNWMKEAVSRLYAKQPSLVGAVAADGGRPREDLLADLPGADWSKITAEFFVP